MYSTDAQRARPRTRWTAPATAITVLAATACTSHSAPSGFLPDPREAQTDAYGSWIDVTVTGNEAGEEILGELIAIDADTTWVLGTSGIRSFATAAIVQGRLVAYDSRAGAVGGGAVVGFVSTISNGVFLILTGPMWIIGGSVAAAQQSRRPIHDLTEDTPASFGRFARFPMGLPEGLDPATLEGRPGR